MSTQNFSQLTLAKKILAAVRQKIALVEVEWKNPRQRQQKYPRLTLVKKCSRCRQKIAMADVDQKTSSVDVDKKS